MPDQPEATTGEQAEKIAQDAVLMCGLSGGRYAVALSSIALSLSVLARSQEQHDDPNKLRAIPGDVAEFLFDARRHYGASADVVVDLDAPAQKAERLLYKYGRIRGV
jgi:hypothetical protein